MHTCPLPWSGRRTCWPILLGVSVLLPSAARAAGRTGEQIFQQQCASCHGMTGQGTADKYPKPLAGSRSVAQLARLISRTMPKDAPKKCTGEDARKVAAYIYDAFYSTAARARNKAPRVELSRLTVRQYQNAVADLIGSFRTPGHWDNLRGLRGQYYQGGRRVFQPGSNRGPAGGRIERIDPEVRFDFGTASPDPKKLSADRFGARWQGSVRAPESGEYEFIVRTEHAVRLWVNDEKQPLIDAWVKSGNDTEYRATLTLLGGWAYPLRLEFFKGRRGDPDGQKNKYKPPPTPASIALLWKPPHRAAEVIPARDLTPNRFPVVFVLSTPFPPDDRSEGYERGTSISRAWEQATIDAAVEVANYVGTHLRDLAGVSDSVPDRPARLREFCRHFAERAFRRPLTPEQQRFFIDRQFDGGRNPDAAVKRAVLLTLMSPQFLYREMSGGNDPYNVASRLSFDLWDSLPDEQLLKAAAAGQLATREQVARQAERMLGDLRARGKLHDFFMQWLKVDQSPDLGKDPKLFPKFDPAVASDLRTSLELFVEDVLWSGPSDFRQLFLADSLYLDGRLARFYGADLPADAPFQKVFLNPAERAGVLTHPYLMTVFAYTGTSSPIHRGVFLARNVLGRVLRPPPEAFTPLAPDLHPNLTTRERVALQTSPRQCQACHGLINHLGYTMEHFDAVGRFRDRERGKPIDATGTYQTRTGDMVKFAGVRDLARYLADSPEAHQAFVERLFHYLVKQPVQAYGPRKLGELERSFRADHDSMRKLMVEIIAQTALTTPEAKTAAPPAGARASAR
jgi:cytochrome c553